MTAYERNEMLADIEFLADPGSFVFLEMQEGGHWYLAVWMLT